jgi:alanyl-tRNA synthetase
MKSREIREKFLQFFEKHGHQRVRSSSVIPASDPTLLFTNAGMNQFKDVFLGLNDPGYRRATSCQKCVRAGGKHNDLENVGFTPRHHTFFEMLGNFSFGDYFKKDAIHFAWDLVTRELGLPKDRLRVTVFEKDDEAFDHWKSEGVKPEWITRLGEKDNFWAMGDTGPCGPCSEIFYDWGKEHGCDRPDCGPGCPCDTRFLEIWNLVFMQFNRSSDGTMVPLPKPSVDTGSGLERVSAVMQGKYSNYDTDVFFPLIQGIEKITGKKYHNEENADVSMRVIADHLRAGTFLLSDGVVASNEGRGYVLRRILRRAIRHGKKLGQEKPFIFQLVKNVVDHFGNVYPELAQNQKAVEVMMREEEERFHETLHRGMGLLEENIQKLVKSGTPVLPGDVAFKLYDTFGFPFDLISVIAQENKLSVDEKGFASLMEKQRQKSTWNKSEDSQLMENLAKTIESKKWETPFLGYDNKLVAHATALGVFSVDGKEAPTLATGANGFVIFQHTPFYAESGGQVGDKGIVTKQGASAKVDSTFKIGRVTIHGISVTAGKISPGEEYELNVEPRTRQLTAVNHTATHMLHAALRTVLGDRVKQAGSLVEPERLRFDFAYPRAVAAEELTQIEQIINDEIRRADGVETQEMSFDQAMKTGALAFFDEKYGDRVRVVRVGGKEKPFSVELCGGTHLTNTEQVGVFKVLSESSVASGVRRIEAVTSVTAVEYLEERHRALADIEDRLNAKGNLALSKVEQLLTQNKSLQKEVEDLKLKAAQGNLKSGNGAPGLHERAVEVKGKNVMLVMEKVAESGPKILRTLVDQIRDKLKDRTIVVLGSEVEGKASICVGLTKDLVGKYDAAKLIQPLAQVVGGTGGGRPDFAQAGGPKPELLDQSFSQFREWLDAN